MLSAKVARKKSLLTKHEKELRSYEKIEKMFNDMLKHIEEDIEQAVSEGLFSIVKDVIIEEDLTFLTERRIEMELQKHGYKVEVNDVESNLLSQIQRKAGKDKVGLKISVRW